MTYFPLAALLMFLTCGPPPTSPSAMGGDQGMAALTDEQFVRRFLTDWLVRRDLEITRGRLAPDFFLQAPLRRAEVWPPALQPMTDRERALRFPFACPNAPAACRKLSDCADAMQGSGEFDLRVAKIDDEIVGANPDIRPRAGHDALLVKFMVKGCNLGAALIVDKTDGRKVVTIFYLAG